QKWRRSSWPATPRPGTRSLEAAGKAVETKAGDAKDNVKHAHAAMLDSVHKAALSLSQAVADLRTKAAQAIAPKADVKPVAGMKKAVA
ncbi:MAG: hypothetical protein ABI832_23935, partial [bacterium]